MFQHILHWFHLFDIYSYDGDAAAKDAPTSTSDTDAMEESGEVQSLLASLKEAFEAQSAAMIDLQAQLKMFAENQDANMKWLQVQIAESAKRQKSVSVADGESDDYLRRCTCAHTYIYTCMHMTAIYACIV